MSSHAHAIVPSQLMETDAEEEVTKPVKRETKTKTQRERKSEELTKEGSDNSRSNDKAVVPIGKRNLELGRRGESAAARFLYRRGYEILERNWTCVAGEADIIARDGSALVFVEVKTRSSLDKGFPSEAVDAEKRSRYERIAALFLQGYDVVDIPVRFDVVALVLLSSDRAMIRHHINAFGVG